MPVRVRFPSEAHDPSRIFSERDFCFVIYLGTTTPYLCSNKDTHYGTKTNKIDDEPHGFSPQGSYTSFVADSSLKRGYFKDNSSIFYVSSLKLVDFKDERCMAVEVKLQFGKLHVTCRAAKPAQAINASTACERNCLNKHKYSL